MVVKSDPANIEFTDLKIENQTEKIIRKVIKQSIKKDLTLALALIWQQGKQCDKFNWYNPIKWLNHNSNSRIYEKCWLSKFKFLSWNIWL